jgi:hypothetical protein
MGGAVHPLPNTPSWRGARLGEHRDNFTFTLPTYSPLCPSICVCMSILGNTFEMVQESLICESSFVFS